MAETATQQLSRVMSMVPYIAHRPGVTMTALAREYGITAEQVQADLYLLMVCGVPGYYPDDLIDVVLDEDGGTVSMGFQAGLDRPVRLTGDEAVALVAALRALRDLPGLVETDAVDSALTKIEQAGGGAVADSVRVDAGDSSPSLGIVRAALQTQRRLWMRYYTASRDAVSERVVDPIRLLITDGHSYLEAFCHTAGGVRNFRVDRIDEARVLAEPAQQALWNETSVPERMFRPDTQTPVVSLRLAPSARWVADYYLVTRSELVAGGSGDLLVELPVPNDDWLVRLVISLGGTAALQGRPDLTAEVANRASAALQRYRDQSDLEADDTGS
ncbi:MAG: WYL domain-containing protein [Nakamurella sp.]